LCTKIFETVLDEESAYIKKRRKDISLSDEDLTKFGGQIKKMTPESKWAFDKGHVGLALSGGGIRSATFNLGLLQGLAKTNVLRFCDYLSTVSGGGYIGACLSSLLNNEGASVLSNPFRNQGEAVLWLRRHSNYLVPDMKFFGLDLWRLIGSYLSGLVLTNVTTGSLMLFLAYLLHFFVNTVANPMNAAMHLLCIALFSFLLLILVRWGTALRSVDYHGRRYREYIQAGLTVIAVLFISLSGLIMLAVQLPKLEKQTSGLFSDLLHGGTVFSILGLLIGLKRKEDNLLGKILNGLFSVSWIILLPILLAQLVRFLWITDPFSIKVFCMPVLIVVAIVLLIVGWFTNTNRISLHHFYRDRLSETYMIKRSESDQKVCSNESLSLTDLHHLENGAPYHLINATLNIPSSENQRLRGRGADSFIFSKNYCGSESTGYQKTKVYDQGETRLATAMAISGAALSPEMGELGSPIKTFLLTLLNIRMNRWMPNPSPSKLAWVRPFWPYYFVKELFDRGTEKDRLLNLSDGGHYENLGVYELIKRRCAVIIASDAGADPDFSFIDLANLIRKVRIDFGAEITIDLTDVRRDKEDNVTTRFAVGTITYPDKTEGILIYIKASMTGREPEDLVAYRRENKTFPDESTADQFFDEAQFESYRELGYLTGKAVFS